MAKYISKIFFSVCRPSPTPESVRLYSSSKWMPRSPSKVHLPFQAGSKSNLKKEKIIDLDPCSLSKNFIKEKSAIVENTYELIPESVICPDKSKEIKQKRDEKLKKQKFYLSQQKVFDDNGEIIYEKLKDKDSRVNSLMVKLKSKKDRARLGQILVEGWRLIVDGIEAQCSLRIVLFSRTSDLDKIRPFLPEIGVTLYKISYKELQRWSDVETSPGILGVFETPTADKIKTRYRPLPLQFICDNIRVPGNLGAILRAAVGAGCEKVLLSKGCVDLWDPKVIRSAAGAHFRLPICHSIDWKEMPSHLEPTTSVFIADSNTTSYDASGPNENLDQTAVPVLPYYGVDFSTCNHTTLIIGGETEGISKDSYSLAASNNGLRLNIPLQVGVDSLNTAMATAIIAFEIRKQIIQSWRKQNLDEEIAQSF